MTDARDFFGTLCDASRSASANAPIHVEIDASAMHGQSIPVVAERLRNEVDRSLRAHTELNIVAIDISIRDIREVSSWTDER